MNNDNLESTKFYSQKSRNFSTIIILPTFILIILIFTASVFVKREETIQLNGRVEPKQIMKIKNINYVEGQVLKKDQKVELIDGKSFKLRYKSVVHAINTKDVLIYSNPKKELVVASYIPVKATYKVHKGQRASFKVNDGSNHVIYGKVTYVSKYADNESFKLISTLHISSQEMFLARYGIKGKLTIITSQDTYFNHLKKKLINK